MLNRHQLSKISCNIRLNDVDVVDENSFTFVVNFYEFQQWNNFRTQIILRSFMNICCDENNVFQHVVDSFSITTKNRNALFILIIFFNKKHSYFFVRTNARITTLWRVFRTFANAFRVFTKMMQTSQTKFEIFEKKNENERKTTIVRFYRTSNQNFSIKKFKNLRVCLSLQKINEWFWKLFWKLHCFREFHFSWKQSILKSKFKLQKKKYIYYWIDEQKL